MKKQQNGFTLIELIVAITIGMLVVGFGAVSLNNFWEKQKISGAVKELVSNLRLARDYAVTNQLPQNGNRILVTINSDGLMTAISQTSDNIDVGSSFFQKDITPNDVTITGGDQIRFSVTDGRLVGVTSLEVVVSGIEDKIIRIDESGLIYGK